MAQVIENVIEFPYKRSLGPVIGAFMSALTERRILGNRSGARVLVPPSEWDPLTGASLEADFVEVGPAGTVTNWTWVGAPTGQHPLRQPFAFAFIRLDGADTDMFHAVDAGDPGAMAVGMRVAPRWRAQRVGRIDDIECFVPGETSVVAGEDAGPATEPVTMMDYAVSITYHNPVAAQAERVVEASAEGKLLGARCPVCGRVYGGGRGYCPVDSVALGPDDELELPQRGVITNYTIVTPVQYPGQTETEPFARAMVLLDGTEVILGYQPLVEFPVGDMRVGARVAAVWASPAERDRLGGAGMGGTTGYLVGWMPTGEPDVDDPDLVNRIF